MAAQFTSLRGTHPKNPKVTLLTWEGEVDEYNQEQLENLMQGLLKDPTVTQIIIDLQKLEYFNSRIIGYLATVHGEFIEKGKRFVFVNPNEYIYDVMDLVGLLAIIECFRSTEEALLSFE
ncbi:MAG TPA: STAS domain-containing protein [Candidatus Gracilibacteria bacterium]|nr:STAS domain-containing protein [Candidatus Gracilibacteria bacterium]